MARAKTTGSKAGAAPRAPSKPLQAGRPSRAAPDTPSPKLSPEDVYKLIQESAYFKAKERGFAPGHEVQDWIEAEAEVRRRLEDRAR